MFIGLEVFWQDRIFRGERISIGPFLIEIIPLFGAVLMYLYFLKSQDQKGLRFLIYSSFLFIVVTTILSINGLMIQPHAVRLAMQGAHEDIDLAVRSIGMGNYGFFNGILLLMPVMGYLLTKPESSLIIKAFILLFASLLIFPMVVANLTTTLLLAVLFFIYTALFLKKFKSRLYVPIIIVCILLFVLNEFTAEILFFISEQLSEGGLKSKLDDLSLTIRMMDFNPEESDTHFAGVRLALTLQSLHGFLANPLIGTGEQGGHAYWLDRLAMFGLIGWFPVLLIFYQQVKLQKRTLLKVHYPYFVVSVYAIILLGVLKGNIVSQQTMLVLFFIVPGIFLLEKNLNSKSMKKNS